MRKVDNGAKGGRGTKGKNCETHYSRERSNFLTRIWKLVSGRKFYFASLNWSVIASHSKSNSKSSLPSWRLWVTILLLLCDHTGDGVQPYHWTVGDCSIHPNCGWLSLSWRVTISLMIGDNSWQLSPGLHFVS